MTQVRIKVEDDPSYPTALISLEGAEGDEEQRAYHVYVMRLKKADLPTPEFDAITFEVIRDIPS